MGLNQAVFTGQAQADSSAPPLSAFSGLFTAIADRCREGGASVTDRLLGSRGKSLALHVGDLAGLPGQERFPDPAELPPEAAELRLGSYVAECLRAFSADRSLLLLLDDLHGADGLTRGVLSFLLKARALSRMPVLVIGTYRALPGEEPLGPLHALSAPSDLRLGKLGERDVFEMVGAILAMTPPPEALCRSVLARSEGNPFFVVELLRVALSEGMLARDEAGRWRVKAHVEALDLLPLPESVKELVLRRLQALPRRCHALARLASILGQPFEETLLVSLALDLLGSSAQEVGGLLADLVSREIVEPVGGARLRFLHEDTAAAPRLWRRLRSRRRRRRSIRASPAATGSAEISTPPSAPSKPRAA